VVRLSVRGHGERRPVCLGCVRRSVPFCGVKGPFFWLPIELGFCDVSDVRVRIASSASCFALFKPTKGASIGSQRMTMFVLGWNSRMTSSFFSVEMDAS
jgi:hypothetical protein